MSSIWPEDEARETPVDGVCIWCKREAPPEDRIPLGADDDGEPDEYVCRNCRGDLRMFGRAELVQLYTSGGLEPAVRRIVLDHYEAVRSELLREHADDPDLFPLPRRKSSAQTYESPANGLRRDDGDRDAQ